MRKKLIIVIAVQVLMLSVFLAAMKNYDFFVDKYGKTYYLDMDMTYCYEPVYPDEDDYAYIIELTGYGKASDLGIKPKKYYTNASSGKNYINIYNSRADDHMSWSAGYEIGDKEIGKKLCEAFENGKLDNTIDGSFSSSLFNLYYNVSAEVKILGGRVKLVSVTVNGTEIEEFFGTQQNIVA